MMWFDHSALETRVRAPNQELHSKKLVSFVANRVIQIAKRASFPGGGSHFLDCLVWYLEEEIHLR